MSNQPIYRRSRSHSYSCRCPRCHSANAYGDELRKGLLIPVVGCAAIGLIVFVATVPLRIWHVTGSDGKQHPDSATWIAYGICAVLVLAAMMAGSIRASRNGTSR